MICLQYTENTCNMQTMTFFLKKITLFRLICLLFSQIVFYSCVGNSEVSSDSVVGDVVFSTVWFRSFAV